MNMMVFHSKPLNYQEGKRRTGNIPIVGHVIQQAAGVPLLSGASELQSRDWHGPWSTNVNPCPWESVRVQE